MQEQLSQHVYYCLTPTTGMQGKRWYIYSSTYHLVHIREYVLCIIYLRVTRPVFTSLPSKSFALCLDSLQGCTNYSTRSTGRVIVAGKYSIAGLSAHNRSTYSRTYTHLLKVSRDIYALFHCVEGYAFIHLEDVISLYRSVVGHVTSTRSVARRVFTLCESSRTCVHSTEGNQDVYSFPRREAENVLTLYE